MSDRQFFSGGSYCNSDNFQLVVQSYSPANPSGLAYYARRRDGFSQNYWGSDEFAFTTPHHVFRDRIKFDEALLVFLMSPDSDRLMDAVTEFNAANTDAWAVPAHTELIMIKSALERVLDARSDAFDLERKLSDALKHLPREEAQPGQLTNAWSQKWKKSSTLLGAWCHEFCLLRNVSAHGVDRSRQSYIWSIEAHLAFASMLFPLVVKAMADQQGARALTGVDRATLSLIDSFIAHDPMGPIASVRDRPDHPWAKLHGRIALDDIATRLYPDERAWTFPPDDA